MMLPRIFRRREFVSTIAAGIVAPQISQPGQPSSARNVQVPWSSGTERPRTKVPPLATDSHHHIYDSRFPISPKAVLHPADATVADYRLLQNRLGISRNVIVQPSTYGVDNRCLLDALQQFGLATTRGIAVVDPDVSDAELKHMDTFGVRGIRFNVVQAGGTALDRVEPLAKRIAALGWHIQVNAAPEQIRSEALLWKRVPVSIVFDHLAHIPKPGGSDSAYAVVSNFLQTGKAWVKLSGGYIDSAVGPPSYADRTSIAQAYVKEAPQRLVWGTDWPHPTARQEKPDDAVLLDLLAAWVPDEITRNRILVDNAAELYHFT